VSGRLWQVALLACAVLILGAANATVTIKMPFDTVQFKPGPGASLATANCATCHSAAYIYTQPRLTRKQWTAEVLKMKKLYGAPLDIANVDAIVNYLMTQNGKQ